MRELNFEKPPAPAAPAPSVSYAAVPAAAPAAGPVAASAYDNRVWNNICYNNLGNQVDCRNLGKNYKAAFVFCTEREGKWT